ncbi:TIR domain-containing protein [Marinobacter lipolyticus]|uniref:TIR domain-containing protein n=1 Tax=Marinobacter lipolyticus TaxID=209639 RepID=UPI003A8E9187
MINQATGTDEKKYLAFISYRHSDNKVEGRQWATWLHQAIETYEVPADLVGKPLPGGGEIPARIYPIFRDEEELPANADLSGAITRALDCSSLLVVLCSPRAVESTYVADEIDYFKKLGRSARIIAAIIDGEPNTSWDEGKQAAGFKASDECFPIPLQFEYADGERTSKHAEPIAADFRLNDNGTPLEGWTTPEAYRQALKADGITGAAAAERVAAYEKQLHLMLLKIIAGILGVPLSDLTKRDKEYQLARERERAKKLRRWLAAVAMLAVVAIGAGIFAYFKQQEAEVQRQVAVERLMEQMIARAETLTVEAEGLIDEGRPVDAVKKLIDAMPEDVSNPEWPISTRTKVALNRAMTGITEFTAFKGPKEEIAEIRPVGGDRILLFGEKGTVYLYHMDGTLIGTMPGVEKHRAQYHIRNDGSEVITASILNRTRKGEYGLDEYTPYFVSRKMDLKTGEVTELADQLVEEQYPHDLLFGLVESRVNQVFARDGDAVLMETSTDGYQLLLMDVETGAVTQHYPLPGGPYRVALYGERYAVAQLSGDESAVVVADIDDGSVRSLLSWQGRVVCEDGAINRAWKGEVTTGMALSVNADNTHLMAAIPTVGENRFSEWCLTGWPLAGGEQLPIRTFDTYANRPLDTVDQNLLALAYGAEPTTVLQKNGHPRRVENGAQTGRTAAYRYFPGRQTMAATARGDTISLTHAAEETLIHDGGAVNSLYLTPDGQSLWIAGTDGMIHGRSMGSRMESFPTGLANVNTLRVEDSFIFAAQEIYGEDRPNSIRFALSDRRSPGFGQQYELLAALPEAKLEAGVFGTDWPGIIENSDNSPGWGDEIDPSKQRVWRIDPTTGDIVTAYAVRTEQYSAPAIGRQYGARIEDGQVMIVALENGTETPAVLPDGMVPFTIAFLGDRLFIAASPLSQFETPEDRQFSLYNYSPAMPDAPELILEVKAQGVDFEPQTHGQSILVKWLVYPPESQKMGSLSADGRYRPITIAWEDEFSIHFALSPVDDILYVMRENTDVRVFAFDGTLKRRILTDQRGYGIQVGRTGQYLLSDDAYISLQDKESCPAAIRGSGLRASPTGRYLLNGDSGTLYDMDTCTALFDLPLNLASGFEESQVMEDGTLWIVRDDSLYRLSTRQPFMENYRLASEVLRRRKAE